MGQIGYNGVSPVFRGHGIGRCLLDKALDELRLAGMEHVEVVTGLDDGHAAARRLYEGAGFRPIRSMVYYSMPLE